MYLCKFNCFLQKSTSCVGFLQKNATKILQQLLHQTEHLVGHVAERKVK